MTDVEFIYLVMVIAAGSIFAVTLAICSTVARDRIREHEKKRAETPRTLPHTAAKV